MIEIVKVQQHLHPAEPVTMEILQQRLKLQLVNAMANRIVENYFDDLEIKLEPLSQRLIGTFNLHVYSEKELQEIFNARARSEKVAPGSETPSDS